MQSLYNDSQKFIIFVPAKTFFCLVNTLSFIVFALIILCTAMANVVCHIKNKKKAGHLVNLGELVGPETYNLLCVA